MQLTRRDGGPQNRSCGVNVIFRIIVGGPDNIGTSAGGNKRQGRLEAVSKVGRGPTRGRKRKTSIQGGEGLCAHDARARIRGSVTEPGGGDGIVFGNSGEPKGDIFLQTRRDAKKQMPTEAPTLIKPRFSRRGKNARLT